MSLRNTLKALPTLLKVGFSEAVAYRAEMLIWVLSMTMPFISMALWTAVAREAPVRGYTGEDFVRYFLATFAVRQLTGAWAAWQMNFEVRQGTLSMRLLRPISPLWAYAVENVAAMPLRLVVVIPVLLLNVVLTGPRAVPDSAVGWGLFLLALGGGWLISFLINVIIGTMCFFMESSLKVLEVWMALFAIFSGYLYPVELFPPTLRQVVDWLPFRYQIGLPVELVTGTHAQTEALLMLGRQWLWVGLLGLGAVGLWRLGLRRFAAYGG